MFYAEIMAKYANSIFQRSDDSLSVAILLLNETSLMEVAALIDPMRAANRFADKTVFSWTVATPNGEAAQLTSGVLFPANVNFRELPHADVLVILAGFNHSVHAPPELTRHLSRIAPRFRALGAVDSGGWVLARAGLLAGHKATVHWEDLEEFARTFPNVEAVPDRFVISDTRFTAGGALPTLDLMVHLIGSRFGPDLAAQVTGAFIHAATVPGVLPQQTRKSSGDTIVDLAVQIIERHTEDPKTIREIATRLGISLRQLETRFQTRLGIGPGRYATDLRLQTATRLARDTSATFTDIAVQCGFTSQAVFTRAFKTKFGITPGNFRRDRNTLITQKMK